MRKIYLSPITVAFFKAFLFSIFPCSLFFDSTWMSHYFDFGQTITNYIMLCIYCSFLWIAKPKLFKLILLMTICSFNAEILGTHILSLYQYRLHNIPFYVPIGHAVLYACVYFLATDPWIWHHHATIEKLLKKGIFLVVFLSWIFLNDTAGLITYALFIIMLSYRPKPLFYLLMFSAVYGVEVLGSLNFAWTWYGLLENHPNYPSTYFFPAGIAGCYMLIDMATNYSYLFMLKFSKKIAWQERLKIQSQIESL